MFRLLFWLTVFGVIGFVLSGTSALPGLPLEEIVYATPPPVATCSPTGCIAVYTLEVGNVGKAAQESVRVRMRADAIASPLIAPTVRRAGENAIAEGTDDRPGIQAFPIGRLEPDERVTLLFALRATSRESVAGWDRLLVGVDASAGSARPGE